jgi:hypothetical protein
MNQAYIIDAVRSPTGRRKGGLSHIHGADLGAHVIKAIVDRNGIPDEDYEDVIFGCVDTVVCRRLFRVSRSTGNAGPRSNPCISRPRQSWPERWTWCWQVAFRR